MSAKEQLLGMERARASLRSEARARIHKKPSTTRGVIFLRSWRMYFPDCKVYSFPLEVAAKLVKAGTARYDVPKIPPVAAGVDKVSHTEAKALSKRKRRRKFGKAR